MGSKYKAGVPELGLPAIDPLVMPEIELNLGNSKVKFEDIVENCCCLENTDKGENLSCTPLLAKTTHRTINKSGRGNLVERFQPQITGSVGGLVKNYLNGSFRQVDASVFF